VATAGMVEGGGAQTPCTKPKASTLARAAATHAVGGGAVPGWNQAPFRTRLNAESQHLRQVGLDKALGLVQTVVEQAVGALAIQTSVQQLLQKRGEALPVRPAGRGESRNRAVMPAAAQPFPTPQTPGA